jgi:hypothetical protein
LNDPVENESRAHDENDRDREVANERPTAAQDCFERDCQRHCEQPDEGGSPRGVSPGENCLEGPSDLAVLLLCRCRGEGRQSDDDRSEEQEGCVDRTPVPSSRLGRREERELPSAGGRRFHRTAP